MKPNEVKDFFLLEGCYYRIMRAGLEQICKFEFGFTSHASGAEYIDFLPEADIKPGDILSNPGDGEFYVVKTELQIYGADEIPYQLRVHCKAQFKVPEAERNSICLNILDDRPVYRVSLLNHPKIRLGATDPIESVLQCVSTVMLTPKGTVPLYREFGLSWEALEYPISAAKSLMAAEIKHAIERWEPRASVIGLTFERDAQNPDRPAPIVWIVINEDM